MTPLRTSLASITLLQSRKTKKINIWWYIRFAIYLFRFWIYEFLDLNLITCPVSHIESTLTSGIIRSEFYKHKIWCGRDCHLRIGFAESTQGRSGCSRAIKYFNVIMPIIKMRLTVIEMNMFFFVYSTPGWHILKDFIPYLQVGELSKLISTKINWIRDPLDTLIFQIHSELWWYGCG